MTLQQLAYFLSAAEHGSFSAAADSLHMAQPSLSEQIRRLEAELGVSLFARTGRRLELTEAEASTKRLGAARASELVRVLQTQLYRRNQDAPERRWREITLRRL